MAQDGVGEIPTDLYHERVIRPGSYSGNVYFSRRQLDDDEHIVGHGPANCGDLDGEEVGRSNGFPMGGEKRARRVQKHKRVAKPVMVELSMIVIDELGDGPARGS